MEIYPDYTATPICHYCRKTHAVKESQYIESWYGIVADKILPLSVKYIKINVAVPRCTGCEKRHNVSAVPTIVIFIMSIIIGVYLMFLKDGGTEWNEQWYGWALGLILIFILSLFASFVLGTLLRYMIHGVLNSGKCKDVGDTRDYPPIRKLVGCGFQYTKPDGAKAKSYRKIKPELFHNTIKSIREKDGCIIKA